MDDWCGIPSNDRDIKGIHEYITWAMTNAGFGSDKLHYVTVLARNSLELEKQVLETRNAIKSLNKKIKQLSRANTVISYAVTCRKENQPEWMVGLAEYLNEYLGAVGDSDRFEYNGESIVKVREAG